MKDLNFLRPAFLGGSDFRGTTTQNLEPGRKLQLSGVCWQRKPHFRVKHGEL